MSGHVSRGKGLPAPSPLAARPLPQESQPRKPGSKTRPGKKGRNAERQRKAHQREQALWSAIEGVVKSSKSMDNKGGDLRRILHENDDVTDDMKTYIEKRFKGYESASPLKSQREGPAAQLQQAGGASATGKHGQQGGGGPRPHRRLWEWELRVVAGGGGVVQGGGVSGGAGSSSSSSSDGNTLTGGMADLNNGQCRMKKHWKMLWLFTDIIIVCKLCPKFRWCIIIWCRVVVVPICQLIRATGRQPRIVDGRVNLYQQHGRWYIEMESGAPFLIPERFALRPRSTSWIRMGRRRCCNSSGTTARQHFQSIHITIPLEVVLPRFCEYADLTHQVRVTDQWNINWVKCVLSLNYKLIKQRKDAVLKVVNGRAIPFEQGLYWYLQMVKKNGGGPAPPLRLPRCFCVIAELFRLTPVERSFVKGNNLPARDDSSKTNNQQELRDTAREMVEASTTTHPDLKAVIQPTAYGIKDDTGAVPEGYDLTAHHLGIILKTFENQNPIDEEWEDEAMGLSHALQHLTDRNVIEIGRGRRAASCRAEGSSEQHTAQVCGGQLSCLHEFHLAGLLHLDLNNIMFPEKAPLQMQPRFHGRHASPNSLRGIEQSPRDDLFAGVRAALSVIMTPASASPGAPWAAGSRSTCCPMTTRPTR
ncbi:unnamed protein product [Vitrella brassicaformis CCMP3155]|uniref:Uncharacterized protein n=1 Tax=Vitrella brassicaformis (strain CCMP3155) TaxID=1169540 RepID=A0A0G4F0K2_VITBC|nr:unnamed protein product [Vitrella brassicaformis CCMP3155]|eukprot:CEM04585.1 unnamed protein product [Vitrella brassicaformis CCMP3155]